MAALTQALASAPAVVLVEGEAGIGKTRLIREYLSSQSEQRPKVISTSCPPFRTPATLGPIVDMLRTATGDVRALRLTDLAGALRPLFPEWAAELPPAPEPLEDAASTRHRLFRAMAELLDRLCMAVVVVEDAHWADEATLEFLLFLTAHQQQKVSLIVTYRPEDMPSGSLIRRLPSRLQAGTTRARIALSLLDADATGELISSMLDGAPVSPEFAAFLHKRTDGLPLAIEESLRLMGDRADVAIRDGAWTRRHLADIEVPPTVRDTVLERVERLSAETLLLLRAAAVLAEPATEPVLVRVARLAGDKARTGLYEALSCGLLIDTGSDSQRLAFRHALAARAVYEAVPAPLRREMHQRAGRVLQNIASVPPVRLARHFREAGDPVLWCRYGEQAADLALASGDQNTATALLYDLITTAALSPPDAARLTAKIPFAMLGDAHELISVLRSVLDSGIDRPDEEADVRYQLGRVLATMDHWDAAHIELMQAVPHLTHDPVAAVRGMVLLSWPLGTEHSAAEHLQWLRRAREIDVPMTGVERLRLMTNRVTALLLLGEEEGWEESARSLAETVTTGDGRLEMASMRLNAAHAAVVWGRYAEARRRIAECVEQASQGKYWALRQDSLALAAHLDWLTGAWEGLEARVGELGNTDHVYPSTHVHAALVAGLLHAVQGTREAAVEELRLALEEQTRGGIMLLALEPAAWLARLLLADGRADDALAVTEEPMRVLSTKGIWLWAADIVPVRVQGLIAAGRSADASALTAAFTRGLRGRGFPAAEAGLATARAHQARAAGEHERAATTFAQAASAWQQLPRPYEAYLAREQQGHCLIAARETERGLAELSEIFEGLSGLGAKRDADRVMHTLREHGVATPWRWRGGRRGYGEQLSPRELEVVQLLAQGQTDREIAAALFLSPKTIARHLDSARRKLHVRTRVALAAKAQEAGLLRDQPQVSS